MRKGFLTGTPKHRSGDASAKKEGGGPAVVAGCAGATTTGGGGIVMKRGFLLPQSSPPKRKGGIETRSGARHDPHCKPETNDGGVHSGVCAQEGDARQKKKVVAKSTALLDFEEQSSSVSTRAEESKPAVSSLLYVLDDEPGDNASELDAVEDDKEESGGGGNCSVTQSLDSWIGSPASSSLKRPIVLPSSSRSAPRSQRTGANQRSLIVEVENSTSVDENASSRDCQHSFAPDTGKCISVGGAEAAAVRVPSRTPPPKGSLRFANDVSLLLAQLRRSMKDKAAKTDGAVNGEASVIGLKELMDKRSEAAIRSFLTKHFGAKSGAKDSRECVERLGNIWTVILEQVAQDHAESSQSTKKPKRKIKLSASTALGLGVLEFFAPGEIGYESLATLLREVASSTGSHDGDSLKQMKVYALGAVCLLRYRLRCIGVTLTTLEIRIGTSENGGLGEGFELICSELAVLHSAILPVLEGIVSNGDNGGRTVLTSAAMDACFELIEAGSRTIVLRQRILDASSSSGAPSTGDMSNAMLKWRDTLPLMERLVAVKERWAATSIKARHSDDNTDKSREQARVKCALTVLADWLDVIKTSERHFFNRFVGKDLCNEGADYFSGLNLFWNLSGVALRMSEEETPSQLELTFRVGGIAQSLCQEQCMFASSIIGPVCDFGGGASASELVSMLQDSAALTDKLRTATKKSLSSEAWAIANQQRAAVRAFSSWVSKSSKAIRTLSKSTNCTDGTGLLDKSISSLLLLLRTESKQCIDMTVDTIALLWSVSPEWIPREISSETDCQYFRDLLDTLQMHSSNAPEECGQNASQASTVDSTTRALCSVVARVASQSPATMLPLVLKMKGRAEIMIEVVLNMIECLPDNSRGDGTNEVVHASASKVLLQNIETSSYLRTRLRSSQSLFLNVPAEAIAPLLIEYLVGQYTKRENTAAASSISRLLCNIMKSEVNRENAQDFIRCVVASLQTLDKNGSSLTDSSPGTSFLSKNGPLWRLELLDTSSSDYTYKFILLAVAKSMFEMPSSSIPLAVLASVVDGQSSLPRSDGDATDRLEKKILFATTGLLHLAMDQIALTHKSDAIDEETVFARLAPLLILRRIPRSYYTIVHNYLSSNAEAQDILAKFVAFLSDALRAHALKNDQSGLAREERKLLAELAGHCLPFSSDCCAPPISLFRSICNEPFSRTLEVLRCQHQERIETKSDVIGNICQAKTSLYAVSHWVSLALDEEDGEALLRVSSFALEVLNYQAVHHVDGSTATQTESFRRELAMLQSGCIHFLAVCIDSLSCRKAAISCETMPAPLIEDLDCERASSDDTSRSRPSVADSLSKMFNTIKQIVTVGKAGDLDHHSDFGNDHAENAVIRFLPSSRTAMLNSIVMLAQGSKADDKRLDWLASDILPTLVRWTADGPVDDDVRHPLCVAASLQVTYTLLARCGSFDWLSFNSSASRSEGAELDFACLALRCALRSFRASNVGCAHVSVLRLAALKVMLTVIALRSADEAESGSGLSGYLSRAEIKEAMSALRGAANVDEHPEVRALAHQVLPYLQGMSSS